LLEGEAARHRGAGVRAQRGIEPVDVEGDVHVTRQLGEDALDYRSEGLASEHRPGDFCVVERTDASRRRANRLGFLLAKISDSDLHEPRDGRSPCEHVVHDARVRVYEAFVSDAQIGVGVDVQHPHSRMALGQGEDGAQGRRVITSDDPDDLAAIEVHRGLLPNPRADLLASFVDRLERVRVIAGATVGLHGRREGSRPEIQRAEVLGFRSHPDALFPGLAGVGVVQVDLQARLANCRRPLLGAFAIRRGRVEGYREQDHACIFGSVRESEDSVEHRCRVGIEGGRHDGREYSRPPPPQPSPARSAHGRGSIGRARAALRLPLAAGWGEGSQTGAGPKLRRRRLTRRLGSQAGAGAHAISRSRT